MKNLQFFVRWQRVEDFFCLRTKKNGVVVKKKWYLCEYLFKSLIFAH